MPDLAASDLTYTIESKEFLGPKSGFKVIGSIAFGDGALTYPSGGVPITKAKLGLPKTVKALHVMETNAVGYRIEYDKSAEKLRIFESGGAGLVEPEVNNAPVAMVLQLEASGY